ncbi:MAG: radical SAM protein [Eubacteriales bacterium]|jgi:radical SAM superfamily enzyme YgiQ (UPF0313 family)
MKKRVLLIVLPYLQNTDETKTGCWGEKYERKPSTKMRSYPALPYGTLSIATYCKDVADITLFDCNIHDDYVRQLSAILVNSNPDIVGITMTFDNSYTHLNKILILIHALFPKLIIVIGGAATIPVAKEILEEQPLIDAVCFYEGEIPLREILLSDFPYIYLSQSPAWITRWSIEEDRVPQKSVVENLDDIIALDYSFINPDDYAMREEFSPYTDEIKDQKRFFMVMSKGCPYKCAFCYRSRHEDRKMRFTSVEKIVEHVEFLIKEYGMNVMTICDDQFLANRKWAKSVLRALARYNLRLELLQGVSVAFIDEEMAELMKAAGVSRVVLAIESGSQEILNKMVDKPVNLNHAKAAIQILRKYGFWVTSVFVMGFPGETDDHRAETLKWVQEADLDWSTFSAAVPIKGTRLYDICVEGGYIKDDIKLGDMDFSNYFIKTPGYTPEYVAREIYKMNLRVNFVENRAMRIGDYETAIKVFKQVIQMYENHALAHYYLYRCYYLLGKWDESLREIGKYINIVNKDKDWAEYVQELGIGR